MIVKFDSFSSKYEDYSKFNIFLFHGSNEGKVVELCISNWNDKTTNEILKINKEFNLLFVDWFNCDLIKND